MLRWIKAHYEYQQFFKADRMFRTKHFFVPVLRNTEDEFALGITISKRIGKAVVRNLLRRRIKAFFRNSGLCLPHGFKINIIARSGGGQQQWQTISDELCQVLISLGGGNSH